MWPRENPTGSESELELPPLTLRPPPPIHIQCVLDLKRVVKCTVATAIMG